MESRTGSIGRAVLLLLCALAALAAARSIDVESEAEFLVDSASERVLEGFHFSRLERRKFAIIRHIFLRFFYINYTSCLCFFFDGADTSFLRHEVLP